MSFKIKAGLQVDSTLVIDSTGNWLGNTLPISKGGTGSATPLAARSSLGLAIGIDVQAYDIELAALASLTSSADRLPYFTGSGTASTTLLTTYSRTLLESIDAAAARTTLGLVIGTDIQAYSDNLAALASVTSAADTLPYFSAYGAASTTVLTSYSRTLLESIDAAAARATLGLGTISTQDSSNVTITGGTITGLTELGVDNITINGNEISSTNIDGDISLNPAGSGSVDVNGARIINVGTPTASTDAANKLYVDTLAQGIRTHEPVAVATTGTLAAITSGTVTYSNGTSGVGATLTLGTALTVLDGYTLQNNDRILVKNETTAEHNGIYVWATGGTVLTRATDMDDVSEILGGDFFFVQNGTTFNNAGFLQTERLTTLGTDHIIFQQFSGAGTYTAGTGLELTGTVFSNTGVLSINGLTGAVEIDIMGSIDPGSITNDMLAGNIANSKLANSSITITAGTGLSGGGVVDLGGTVTLNSTFVETTYEIGAATTVGNEVAIRLTGKKTGLADITDDLVLIGTGTVGITRNDDNSITINGVGSVETETTLITEFVAKPVDSFSKTLYRSAEYTYAVNVTTGTTHYGAGKILLLHDGTNTYITQYGMLQSNAADELFIAMADVSGQYVRLLIQSTTGNEITFKISQVSYSSV
jgi:hypothetical protein